MSEEVKPYLIVSPDLLTRIQEAHLLIEDIKCDLENEVYRADVLYDQNCHLSSQYDIKCDELIAAHDEIERLTNLLIENKVDVSYE